MDSNDFRLEMRVLVNDILSANDERMKGHFAKNEALFDLINFKLDTQIKQTEEQIKVMKEEIKQPPTCSNETLEDIKELKVFVVKTKTRNKFVYSGLGIAATIVGILKGFGII